MRILFTGDTQAQLSNLDLCQRVLDQILDLIPASRIDAVVHLGDFKHHFNPVDVRVTNFAIEFTRRVVERVPLIVLPGNHDFVNTQPGVPHFLPSMEAAGATVISEPSRLILPATETNGNARENRRTRTGTYPQVGLTALPYERDRKLAQEQYNRAVQMLPRESTTRAGNVEILIFHDEIEGAFYGPGFPGKAGLNTPYFSEFDYCIGGHVHNPQQVLADTFLSDIYYCGSAFCCDWGEVNQAKRLLLLDTSQRTLTSIPSCIPGWYDPAKPGYRAPSSWAGTRVRYFIPIKTDPSKELEAARLKLEKKHPGAILHLIAEHGDNSSPTGLNPNATDADLISQYLNRIEIPGYCTKAQLQAYLQRVLPVGTLGVRDIEFADVTATEVLSFEKVKLLLNRKGLTLVTGLNKDWKDNSNGAGKTSLLSLFVIALFGETLKGQKHDRWRRTGAKAPSAVRLAMKVAGKLCEIIRGRAPGKLLFTVDGADQGMGDPAATQKAIESFTNLTWDVLTNTLFIGQQELSKVFGTEKERKELFSRLLGLERFIRAQEALRKRYNKAMELKRSLEYEVGYVEAALKIVEAEVAGAEAVRDQLRSTKGESVDKLSKRRAGATVQLEALKQKNAIRDKDIEANQRRFEEFLDKQNTALGRGEVLKEQLERAADSKDRRCAVCGSKISFERLEVHTAEIEAAIQAASKQYSKYEQLGKDNRDARVILMKVFQTTRSEIQTLERTVADLNLAIQAAAQHAVRIAEAEERLNSKAVQAAELQRCKIVHTEATASVDEHGLFLQLCLKVVGRDGLPSYLVEQIVPALNISALRFSEAFSEGEINVRFEAADGDIDAYVENAHGGETIMDQSQGEMRIAGLIAVFACRDVLVRHNLLVLDEPGEGLDADNARAFARGLATVVERFQTVFLTTHNSNILSEIEPDYHLQVVKEKRISRLEELC